jgi:CheY-like chemotaxis protein
MAAGSPPGEVPDDDARVDPDAPDTHKNVAAPARALGAVRRALTSRRAPRLRTGIAAFLVVAALLGVLVSALALWAHTIVFDTDAYVRVVAPVAADPEVRTGVAEYVAAKAVQAADLEDRLADALPSAAALAAPALTHALQQFLVEEVERFLATDLAQRLWADINRVAHEQLVSALRDDSRFVTVARDDVRLDLLPLVAVALQKLEQRIPDLLGKDVALPEIDPATAPEDIRTLLQDALGRELPEDFGSVTLLRGDAGYEAKRALELFDDLVIVVVALTAVLIAASLLVSMHRWRTALWLGLGALVAFAAARVVEAQLERAAVGAITSQGGAAVARSVLTAAVASLNGFLVWIAVAGVVVAVAAFLAGRRTWLDAMGRGFAELFGVSSDLSTPDTRAGRWLAGHLDVLRIAGVAVAVVVLLFVTGSPAGVAIVVLGLVIYELALTTYGVGVPRELDQPSPDATADGGEKPAG